MKKQKDIITKSTFTKKDITSMMNLKPNQVKYFVEQGLISDIEATAGTGHYRSYSIENLCEFAILEVLARYGFSVKEMDEILSLIKSADTTQEVYSSIRNETPAEESVSMIIKRSDKEISEEDASSMINETPTERRFHYPGLATMENFIDFEYVVFIYKPYKDAEFYCFGYLCVRDENGNIPIGNESFGGRFDSCIIIIASEIIKKTLNIARLMAES